jgi:hypothetical protein
MVDPITICSRRLSLERNFSIFLSPRFLKN